MTILISGYCGFNSRFANWDQIASFAHAEVRACGNVMYHVITYRYLAIVATTLVLPCTINNNRIRQLVINSVLILHKVIDCRILVIYHKAKKSVIFHLLINSDKKQKSSV